MMPSVAIILVNYKGYEDTVECVKSILDIYYDNFKIFIVDNYSPDMNRLRADRFLADNTEIIYSKSNLGFSGGNNLAIEIAIRKGFDYITLLNNDTTVEPDFLNELMKVAQSNSSIGAVTGKIFYYSRRNCVWSAGGDYNRKTGITIQYSGPDNEHFNNDKEITFATGCLLMFRSDIVKKIGMLDETYFLYSEDTDYCQRIIDAGYKLMYSSKAIIYHKVSASTGDKSPMQQRYMMRNALYMIKKFSPNPRMAYVRITIQMIKHIIRGRNNLISTVKGYCDFLNGRNGIINIEK